MSNITEVTIIYTCIDLYLEKKLSTEIVSVCPYMSIWRMSITSSPLTLIVTFLGALSDGVKWPSLGWSKGHLEEAGNWWFFTNPSEKYARQNGFIFPQVSGVNIKNIFKLPPPILVYDQDSGPISPKYLGFFKPCKPTWPKPCHASKPRNDLQHIPLSWSHRCHSCGRGHLDLAQPQRSRTACARNNRYLGAQRHNTRWYITTVP